MAYMSQDHKKRIATELKKVVPKSWKWSMAVHNRTQIVMTISGAPVDLIEHVNTVRRNRLIHLGQPVTDLGGHIQINELHLKTSFEGKLLKTFEKIVKALNLDNHDNSDLMTDYVDVGHYVSLNIGRWNKPFKVL